MSASPPLRFLALVLGGWAALRTAFVAPPWSTPPAGAAATTVSGAAVPSRRGGSAAPPRVRPGPAPALGRPASATALQPPRAAPHPRPHSVFGAAFEAPALRAPFPAATLAAAAAPALPPPIALPPVPPSPGRWSLSAWAFIRHGDSPALAAGGLLGGSQAGARLAYRLNRDSGRPLALSARLSTPLRAAGAEAALGVDWKPDRRLPVHLLAERRQALGREGRSAFAVTLYGGVSDAQAGRFRIDGYAQAGMVGARSRDPFADGSLRLSLPLTGRARLGAGAWAAAQPGLARLDLGPQAALRLPLAGRAVVLAADWRVRVAGNAGPGSGPTLTIATDF